MSHIDQDPFAEREAQKYQRPIPSREYLLDFLKAQPRPLSHAQLATELGLVTDDDCEALRRRLRAMERDGQLISTRRGGYGVVERMDLLAGRVVGHRDGYGFLIPDDGSEDLYLHNRQMRKLFDGDRALARVSGVDRRGRREGSIVEVLERNTKQVVGRYRADQGLGYLVPDNNRIAQDILVAPDDSQGARDGQYVVGEIVQQPAPRSMPRARIVEILGDHMAPGMEIEVAIRNHDIPCEWPDEVLAEAAGFGAEVAESDKRSRVDLRELPFVTIDGEDARDFDDAVFCQAKKSGGWRLFVAIADVSHYVKPGSALDVEARRRGNSVYFPEHVVPMLPEALSNGLCSLNPQVDRLAMVCEMTISAKGRLSGYQFYEGLICSHARLTYTQVAALIDAPESPVALALAEKHGDLVPHLLELFWLYQALREAREERGAIDFETTETRIQFGAGRKIERLVPVVRNEAHRLIEECMLCANVATARLLAKLKVPTLYRVHEGPRARKLENLRAFLGELGLNLKGGDTPEPADYQDLLGWVENRPDFHIIQTMLLRSLSQAVYSPDNQGHFGLGYSAYTHFTSPIRRYPDLLVHRALRALIFSDQKKGSVRRLVGRALRALTGNESQVRRVEGTQKQRFEHAYPYDMAAVLELGEHCSLTERRADEATRDVIAWLKCEYMQDCIGEVFDGVVSAVTAFGLFVELDEIHVEGLVHVTALQGDYYHFDMAKQRLTGERTRTSYRLGDAIKVKVVRVDLDERKIDFELVAAKVGRSKADKRRKAPGAKSQAAAGAKSKTAAGRGKEAGSRGAARKRPAKSKSRQRD